MKFIKCVSGEVESVSLYKGKRVVVGAGLAGLGYMPCCAVYLAEWGSPNGHGIKNNEKIT